MKFPFFASFIILCLVVRHAINRGNKLLEKSETAFWNEESAANNTRKQSLDSLSYVTFSAAPVLPDTLLDSSFCKTVMVYSQSRKIGEHVEVL